MAYIGNPIYQSAFVTDTFSGNGSTTAFTMSVAPAGVTNVLVAVSGVLQDPATYGVVGTTLNFSAAPPSGTGNISVRYLGVPATGVTTTAYRTVTEFTATAGQTTFTPPSYTVGFIDVYRNGVMLGSADYTATNGTTIVLANPATAGDLVETISFLVSSVLNALPLSGGNLSGNLNLTAGNLGFTGTAQRITGDFSNATVATRTAFQSSTTNGLTGVFFLPNGTSTQSQIFVTNNSDPTNAGICGITAISTESRLSSGITGTGTYLPLTIYTGGTERLRIETGGDVGIGITDPSTKLQLYGTNNTSRNFTNGDAVGATLYLQDSNGASGNGGQILFGATQGSFAGIKGFLDNGTGPAGTLIFQTRSTSGNILERMTIDQIGQVGIGTSSPNAKLQVAGTINGTSYQKSGTTTLSIVYADVSVTGLTTSYQEKLITLPNGITYTSVVNIIGLNGTNDICWIQGFALGEWSGVQATTQARINIKLGNAVASTTGTVRVFYYI